MWQDWRRNLMSDNVEAKYTSLMIAHWHLYWLCNRFYLVLVLRAQKQHVAPVLSWNHLLLHPTTGHIQTGTPLLSAHWDGSTPGPETNHCLQNKVKLSWIACLMTPGLSKSIILMSKSISPFTDHQIRHKIQQHSVWEWQLQMVILWGNIHICHSRFIYCNKPCFCDIRFAGDFSNPI